MNDWAGYLWIGLMLVMIAAWGYQEWKLRRHAKQMRVRNSKDPIEFIQTMQQLEEFVGRSLNKAAASQGAAPDNNWREYNHHTDSKPQPTDHLLLSQEKINDATEFAVDVGSAMYYMRIHEMASCFTVEDKHIDVELKIKVSEHHGA